MDSIKRLKIISKFQFALFLLLSVSQIFSQENIEQYSANGVTKTTFNTSLGKVSVFLPEFTTNERMTGTVIIEPLGNSKNKKNKRKAKLKAYQLKYGDKLISLQSDSFDFKTSTEINNELQLLNSDAKIVSHTVIPIQSNLSNSIPTFIVTNELTKIPAKCDGLISNNNVSINEVDIPILAASETGVFFRTPDIKAGQYELIFRNDDDLIKTKVNVLDLDLSLGRSNLLSGNTTVLSINVSGLQGLEDDVLLDIVNNDTSNVTLEGGNSQQIIIHPSETSSTGNFEHIIPLQANKKGDFSIVVSLRANTQETIESTSDTLLCNCYLNGESFLISPNACLELGGNCSENNTDDTSENFDENSLPNYNYTIPETISVDDNQIQLQINDLNDHDILAVRFSYKPIDDNEWQTIGTDNSNEDGLNVTWNPPLGNDGVIEILTQVVNKNNRTSNDIQFSDLNITPQEITDTDLEMFYSISNADIEREKAKARAIGDKINDEEDKLGDLEDKLSGAEKRKKKNEDAKESLVRIDKILDRIPKAYKDSLKILIDSLVNLKKQLPIKIDTTALKKAVSDAQKRLDDCNKRLEELKKEQAQLETERDDLKKQLDKDLAALHKLFTDNGWTGGHGYHSDGRPYYGYIGDENSTRRDFGNSSFGKKINKLQKKISTSKKQFIKVLKRLKQLPDEIADAEAECEKLNDALEKAKEAAEKGDQYMATEVAVEDICRQIKDLLKPLSKWCASNSEHCDFKNKLKKLLKKCPKDTASLDDFWDEFDKILQSKKNKEKSYGDAVNSDQDDINDVEDDIQNAEDKIKALEEQQRKAYQEAARKRQQRAKEIENARQRRREAEKQKKDAARKKKIKPAPYLDEPVDPSNDQLKYQAQGFIFKRLYLKYLLAKGPCDCITKAMAFANNTNSIVSDLIGRIAVGVAFAPLEAFPGVKLGGRLCIGAVKAIASSLVGGQDLSEELTKNLFNAIGGEIFPKLVGNDFLGDKLNNLAGKGLEKILEAEGVRAFGWEGKTTLRNCGEVSGKTTMLINPNTGWVTILIKIDNCPLIVIKYKVNEYGVPISKPIVKKIKG
jgi:uncharacterized protein with PIN domain